MPALAHPDDGVSDEVPCDVVLVARVRRGQDADAHRPILCTVTGPLPHDLDRMAIADAYNASLIERARPWLRGRVLDVGAGVGTHTARLVGLAGQVVAVEPSPDLAALLQEHVPEAHVVVGDAWSVEGPFDAIVCFNVLEHIADDGAVFSRFAELLSPGGAVCCDRPRPPRALRSARPRPSATSAATRRASCAASSKPRGSRS